ncbi:biotin transporter BioY [Virgibacillus phasianinus]|uniref:Biotin transporter n=1 Tax=Virgibacillus phasianinus TaxID=2017483 RepID=A0A220U3F6_9BACI|nr:biotin transporter BioY [Virgibacillus phasianinus]ASK62688.1 biotin transporter BioY [Virgibacillus phasianinus]
MRAKEITFVALFASIMGALGLVPPLMLSFTPVPITLQTLGVLLSGGLLGGRLGAWSQMVFLLLVAVGIPLLSGGRGGFGVFFGPSGGYILSYPITAFLIGYVLHKIPRLRLWHVLAFNLTVGIFVIYLFGIPFQAMIMNISISHAIQLSLVYLPGDVIKAIIASFLVVKLHKYPIFNNAKAARAG